MNYKEKKIELEEDGFALLPDFFSDSEIGDILSCIENADQENDSFLKTKDLFAIRQLLNHIPELKELIFNSKFNDLISNLFVSDFFLTKAIYFDKTSASNWFVSYHQDLSISVDKKAQLDDYVNWTYKKEQHGVQPPIDILKKGITIRIHLDDTTKDNGALKVLSKSHKKGIIRTDSENLKLYTEQNCEVPKGGIMLMKPLTLHASSRTTNNKQRRVIHLEFNSQLLNKPLNWLEYQEVNNNTTLLPN